jgi:hypothetical protein
MVADRDFGQGYMTMAKSNWPRLMTDMTKMIMFEGAMAEACNLNQRYQPRYVTTTAQVTQCATDNCYSLYWLKQSYLRMCSNDWLNVLMDMSRATAYAEKMKTSCRFKKTWVKRSRLATDEGKMFETIKNIKFDPAAELATPQELNLTEERKLVAY